MSTKGRSDAGKMPFGQKPVTLSKDVRGSKRRLDGARLHKRWAEPYPGRGNRNCPPPHGISEQHLRSPAGPALQRVLCVRPVPPSKAGMLPGPRACLLAHSVPGCSSTPTAPESTACSPRQTALTLKGKIAKIPAEKALSAVTSAWFLRRTKNSDVFPASEPNFPLGLVSSRVHPLLPACTPSPQSQEGQNKQPAVLQPPLERGCPGNPSPGGTYPLLHPTVNPGSTSSTHHPGPGQGSERAHAHARLAQGTDGNPR